MNSQIKGAAKRLVISLLVAGSLGGCAVYAPPYAAYDSAYPYAGPGYVYPPVALDLGFSYYDRGPRYYGGRGWGGWGGHRHHHNNRGFRHGRR